MTQPTTIRNAQTHHLYSEEIGQAYQIFVQLPYKYSESETVYPVLYLLDGDQFFGMVTDTVRLLQHARELPDLVIVGIGYGTDTSDHFVERMRDYAPSSIEQFPYAGGAESFLRFLIEAVIPLINTTYRTNPTHNTLVGASISGLFALYAMLQQSSPFSQFIASSPSISWDNHLIQQMEGNYATQADDLSANLFLSVGGTEEMVDELYAFADTLASRPYTGLTVHTATLPDETHFSVQPAAFTRGLRTIFSIV